MRNNFKIFFIIFVSLFVATLFSCMKKGDYQYIVYMNDGTKVYALRATPSDGQLLVYPPNGDKGGHYYLSSSAYVKSVYVGVHNINEK